MARTPVQMRPFSKATCDKLCELVKPKAKAAKANYKNQNDLSYYIFGASATLAYCRNKGKISEDKIATVKERTGLSYEEYCVTEAGAGSGINFDCSELAIAIAEGIKAGIAATKPEVDTITVIISTDADRWELSVKDTRCAGIGARRITEIDLSKKMREIKNKINARLPEAQVVFAFR